MTSRSDGKRKKTRSERKARSEQAPALKKSDDLSSYGAVSMRPLHILVFLAPLIVLYELGSGLYLHGGAGGAFETIRAHRMLADFFRAFGVGGIYLPGAALVVTLLIWHLLQRDSWRMKPSVLVGMLFESLVWTVPIWVLGQAVGKAMAGAAPTAEPGAVATALANSGAELTELPWQARATIAVGAGLYEELLFRMLGIAFFHFIIVDLLGARELPGAAAAVALSAIGFALYHDVWVYGRLDMLRFGFLFLAGLYFGALYVVRGFGIVVAVHAIYDLAVLLLQQSGGDG